MVKQAKNSQISPPADLYGVITIFIDDSQWLKYYSG
jgi:hypothetical protein